MWGILQITNCLNTNNSGPCHGLVLMADDYQG